MNKSLWKLLKRIFGW